MSNSGDTRTTTETCGQKGESTVQTSEECAATNKSVCILRLQIGPVQEFIAQARSTRDLWSGSFLLSWLMAAGIAELVKRLEASGRSPAEARAALVFPHLGSTPEDCQPMVELLLAGGGRDGREPEEYLTPSLPNILVTLVPLQGASAIAKTVCETIKAEWDKIAKSCWKKLITAELVSAGDEVRFNHQIEHFLSISWQITPFDRDYETASSENARYLDAVRQTRAFAAWSSGGWTTGKFNEKDSLT